MTKNEKLLNAYKKISDFILDNYSIYWSEYGIVLSKVYVEDISKLNYILGRMDNYLSDKSDFNNFKLTLNWFENELNERGYDLEEFKSYIESNFPELDLPQEIENEDILSPDIDIKQLSDINFNVYGYFIKNGIKLLFDINDENYAKIFNTNTGEITEWLNIEEVDLFEEHENDLEREIIKVIDPNGYNIPLQDLIVVE
jgi:hypothetical protein